MSETDQLVKMANQIADNFRFHEDGVARLADHLTRFWAPVMRLQLRDIAASNPGRLEEMVLQAIPLLPEQ